jgi:hypothetical protein
MILGMIQREKSQLALVFNLLYDSYKSSRGCFMCLTAFLSILCCISIFSHQLPYDLLSLFLYSLRIICWGLKARSILKNTCRLNVCVDTSDLRIF